MVGGDEMKTKLVAFFMGILVGFATIGHCFDFSSSDRSGMYPWEHTHVYERIAVVSMPKAAFDQQLMAILMQTPFASQMNVPMEFRPFVVASLLGAVMANVSNGEWQAVTGEPNPVMQPVMAAVYAVLLKDNVMAGRIASMLSAIPLMMPDSAGSAVIELKNPGHDRIFLDYGPEFAMALPWKVGFYVEGDLLNVVILNPSAVAELFYAGLPSVLQENVRNAADELRISVEKAVVAGLYALFPQENVTIAPKRLPPFLTSYPQVPFVVNIADIHTQEEPGHVLIRSADSLNDSLLTMQNPMMTMPVAMNPANPNDIAMFHPFFFQTYAAFDGIASFLTAAYNSPRNPSAWIVRPDGMVMDDFMFLNAKTWTAGPLYNANELVFYRQLLTPMFQTTFLRPRGNELTVFENTRGEKVYAVDIGSPYYGQILLRLGAHRASGTPCKLIAYRKGDVVRIAVMNTQFMFQAFFGDADPRTVTSWEGAFDWPSGNDLMALASEANVLYSGFAAGAAYGLSAAGYEVALSPEAQNAMQMLQRMMNME